MPWTPHPTISDGDGWTASNQNDYVKGNLDTLFPYTAAQQVAYSTSTASLNKATALAGMLLRSNVGNTGIEFGSMVYARQGNSTLGWYTTSTSTTLANYTPNGVIFQAGNISMPAASTMTITFPQAYTIPPLVFRQSVSGVDNNITISFISTATFKIVGSTGITYPSPIAWFAIGEI